MSLRLENKRGRRDDLSSIRAMLFRVALAWGLALAVAAMASAVGGVSP
jgi:hypothetical protein